MNKGSNRPRLLVITWDHDLLSESALRRDLLRLRTFLADPDQQPIYETGSQSNFGVAPVDERGRTRGKAVPAAWRGRVPDPLYICSLTPVLDSAPIPVSSLLAKVPQLTGGG